MNNSFAYFIASYGKPDNVMTLKALKKNNAHYPIYIVVGIDDPKLDEYKSTYGDKLLIFDKHDYIDAIDDVGVYAKSHKICTYSRLAVHDFAINLGIRYVGYLFDDIQYFQLRYVNAEHKIKSVRKFNFDSMIDIYIKLLNSSKDLYLVGPPNSSFYIGIKERAARTYSTRYGNMLVYDTQKPFDVLRSSILEDMDIILANNKVGKMYICPFGLQVCARDPHTTSDAYKNLSKSEWYQHYVLLGQRSVSIDRPIIPYKNFTPKIISPEYRKHENTFRKEGLF